MTQTHLYLTRHGQTEWNVQGRIQGHLDSPLTEKGVSQATLLGKELSSIHLDAIYSSTSPRAKRTAEFIRGNRKLDVSVDDRLREIAMGSWEGMLHQDITLQYPVEHDAYKHRPTMYKAENGGETFQDVLHRVQPFLNEVVSFNQGKHILIVTHTVTLKAIMSFFDLRPIENIWEPPYIHPTSLFHVIMDDGWVQIEKYADVSHLQELEQV